MMCNSFGLKISASSKASFSARAAISSACRGVSADNLSPVLLPSLLYLEDVVDCSRQPITSPKTSQETESRTCATAAARLPLSPDLRKST